MRILIVNDDGIRATGIQTLVEIAQVWGECTVVAPFGECSAISHAISLHKPLRVMPYHLPNQHTVTGTPTDCVYLGIHHICRDHKPDLVLSGINHGPNLGLDVLYSGTVAAAIEATRHGVPAIAFSLAVWQSQAADWQAAKEAVHRVLEWHTTVQKPKGTLFNVNIPPPPLCNPLSLRITHLGKVRYKPEVVQRQDPKDRSYYWIGGHTPEYDQDPHSDCFAIQQKHVAITPLQLDLTDHSTLNQLKMRNL